MDLDNSSSCYLMSVMTLKIIVLQKYRLIFELCHYFILFLYFGRSFNKSKQKHIFRGYKLIFVMVLRSTNGLFFFTTRFHFFTTRFQSPIEGKHNRENAQRWKKAYLEMLIFYLYSLCFLG